MGGILCDDRKATLPLRIRVQPETALSSWGIAYQQACIIPEDISKQEMYLMLHLITAPKMPRSPWRTICNLILSKFFKLSAQCGDLISTTGYDSIIQHLNDGRKNCKEFEDFLKERALIEERYGKELINLSRKKPCGQTELNTLRRALEVFKQQVDSVGQSHVQLAQILREEAKKIEDFREKQKLHRKKCCGKMAKVGRLAELQSVSGGDHLPGLGLCAEGLRVYERQRHNPLALHPLQFIHKLSVVQNIQSVELIMDAIHKNRNMQHKKTLEAKRLYEQRCRDKDEAEQAVHRSTNLVTAKQQEKLFVKLAQTKTALEDSATRSADVSVPRKVPGMRSSQD
ncbi:Proline-serine-threonine phosphatase-interacting protein 2 [Varanus komodoensis]|nr:Proline-serine-threonine phosphatase-interacting protein 2 [Varanus komodoensis]